MTDSIKQKALALVNEVRAEYGYTAPITYDWFNADSFEHLAFLRAIEQHEAFRQEVSDAVEWVVNSTYMPAPSEHKLRRFIAKPDPLVVEAREICARVCEGWVDIPKNRAAAYRDGVHDDEADFAYVLNALRKANERPTHD